MDKNRSHYFNYFFRYADMVGKKVVHPFIPSRSMIVVADDYCKMDFGTGAVKITPAHDVNDYELGNRHNLKQIAIFNGDGIVVNTGTKYDGMKRFDVRKVIIEDLKEIGSYVDTVDNPMIVPMCSRSKVN
jgi:valyl-tRNA synthetase